MMANKNITLTPHQLKYLAWQLVRHRPSCDEDKFTSVLAEAQVDLNPHQVDAALFAFQSPLSMGAILADEVGLGKTIEAALVMSQHWAERKRHILVIAPATLRKQWSMELEEKFFLPSMILEAKNFNRILSDTYSNPFDNRDNVIICSYQFAKKQIQHIQRVHWDLVVIDEAHKLRNVYRASNKTAIILKQGLKDAKKLLLTATPLQNNVKELYGLISIVDDGYFGSLKGFSDRYGKTELRQDSVYKELRERIKPIIHRTLRSDVQEYVKYTERKAMVQEYYPSDDEQTLDQMVSEYLQRDECFGMPRSQRSLISLVLHKLLSSSTFAIAGTLQTIIDRLVNIVKNYEEEHQDYSELDESLMTDLSNDIEELDEYDDEWIDEEDEEFDSEDSEKKEYTADEIEEIKQEISDLNVIHDLALGIAANTKGECLLKALDIAFKDKRQNGQPEKALIFTESNRTLQYLRQLLEDNGYCGKIVLFNGSNTDPKSKEIYQAWKERYQGTSRMTGSMTADKRQALVDYFREEAQIMIATEAASEGINLQFCSLLVNFDLPWNPQRIEQRIGRCHRYGQKNDVVVVNFINKANRADQRVYELLDQKYNLFKGVFGSSDEVLGSTMDGIDFEHRVLDIYSTCRNTEEIDKAFDALQEELRQQIEETMEATKHSLIENFDRDVVNKLRIRKASDEQSLSQYYQLLWQLTISVLGSNISSLDEKCYKFTLKSSPKNSDTHFDVGPYQMGKDVNNAYIYRIGHPLAQYVIAQAKGNDTPSNVSLTFDYTNYPEKMSVIEEAVGKEGLLSVNLVHYKSRKEDEDRIIAIAVDSEGNEMESDFVDKLMTVSASVSEEVEEENLVKDKLQSVLNTKCAKLDNDIKVRDKQFIDEESRKIEQWAEDQTNSLEQELRDIKRRIKELNTDFRKETDEVKRRQIQADIQSLERSKKQKRRDIFNLEEEIEERRDELIAQIDDSLNKDSEQERLFTIHWAVI